MGFLRFGGGKPSIQLMVDRQDVPAGGTVQATVRIAGGKKDVAIDEGRLRLVMENEYTWRERTSTSSSSTTSSGWTTSTRQGKDREVVAEQRFLEPGTVAADSPSEHTLAVQIPAGAVPSAQGKITRVRWKLEATLARRRARDVSDETVLEVLSTEVGWTAPAEEADSHGECDLSFRLEKRAFGAGEPIEGTLVLTPSKECKASEVRVELERKEEVPRGEGNEERVKEGEVVLDGAVDLSPGTPREYPFRLAVPPDPVASLRTDQSTVRWRLKGIGSRRMRSDYNVTQELLVYSSPGSELVESR